MERYGNQEETLDGLLAGVTRRLFSQGRLFDELKKALANAF